MKIIFITNFLYISVLLLHFNLTNGAPTDAVNPAISTAKTPESPEITTKSTSKQENPPTLDINQSDKPQQKITQDKTSEKTNAAEQEKTPKSAESTTKITSKQENPPITENQSDKQELSQNKPVLEKSNKSTNDSILTNTSQLGKETSILSDTKIPSGGTNATPEATTLSLPNAGIGADNSSTTNPTTKATNTTVPVPTSTTTTKKTTTTTTDKSTSVPTTKSTTTPVLSTTTPSSGPITTEASQSCRHFDGPSFIGGIFLTLGLLAIGFISYKFYKARNERNYHTL